MRARAVLAQNSESNALGSVELESLPAGLLIVHLAVGAAGPGYAVGALTQGTSVLVPWAAIERIEQHAEHVFIAFDARLSPHNRLCLTHFSTFNAGDALEVAKQRRILRLGSAGLSLAVAISLSAQIPDWSEHTSQWAALGIGLLAAFLVLALGFAYERLRIGQQPAAEFVLQTVVSEMQHYRPVLRAGPRSEERTAIDWNEVIALLPRSTSALIILLTSAGLALVATSGWLSPGSARQSEPLATETRPAANRAAVPGINGLRADEPVAQEDSENEPALPAAAAAAATSPAAVAVSPSAPTAAAAAPVASSGEACRCERSDSLLWASGFPRITTLLIEKSTRRHKEHQHIELELGAINNGSQSLDDVHLSVLFFEGDSPDPIRERPLYYEGPLRPGQAIKWHVQARGTRFEIRSPTREVLADRSKDFAPADAFVSLLSKANFRPVRLHAVMMLAYLGDARSKQGAQSLREALREVEAPYLDRVIATSDSVRTCDWRAASAGRIRAVSACVYNHGAARLERVAIRARALDRHFDHRSPTADPPIVLAEQAATLPTALEPAQGTRVALDLDTDSSDGHPPVAFEVLVDHEDDR